MAAPGCLRLSLVVTFGRTQGLWYMAGYVWLLTLLSMAKGAFPILGGRTLPPLVDKWFYNGTYASPVCASKFGCRTSGSNVPECSCHENCSLFDECCEDIRPTNWRQLRLPSDYFECMQMHIVDFTHFSAMLQFVGYSYVNVITKCPPGVVSPVIRNFCEKPSVYLGNGTLPLVTDNTTGLTYANKFCAFCYGIKPSRVVNWLVAKVSLDVPFLGLSGSQQRWIKPKDLVELADCRGPYVKSCPANAPPWIQDACTHNPVKRIYDKTNNVVYRNYNCSLCYPIDNPSWSCTQWITNFGAVIEVGLEVLLADYNCPKQLKAFLTDDEKRIWTYACPRITFAMDDCSDTRSMTSLSTLYNSNPTSDYDITSEGVWVRYNDSYTVCASCRLVNYSTAVNYSKITNLVPDNITVNGTTYLLPFFTVVDGSHVAVCTLQSSNLPTRESIDLPSMVSQVLMVVSLLGLTLYAVAYGILQSLQNLPGQMMLHQSIAFFAALTICLVRVVAGSVSNGACIALAVLSHFFFLVAFTWTALYAFEILRAQGPQAYGASCPKWKICYVIVGWLVPALIMVAAITTNWSTSENAFRPAYGQPECFINNDYGQRIFFVAPLAFILLIDVVIYTYMIVSLTFMSSQKNMAHDAYNEKLFLAIKLLSTLGITWIFSVLAAVTGDHTLVYIFELLTSLQGAFVFLIFVCNAKTSGEIRKIVKKPKFSFISGTGTRAQLSHRESSSSGTCILPKGNPVPGVHSFSPVLFPMDAHKDDCNRTLSTLNNSFTNNPEAGVVFVY